MPNTSFIEHPETPFPIGVEYYRAPAPRSDCWDGDFARLRAAGFRVVRSASYWNWMEPQRGVYELDDVDLLFDLAEKHGLSVWLDVMLATHGACPEWLTREHPDMLAVNRRGERATPDAGPAYPQGAAIHCYDHPLWRQLGGALLRHVVSRYKDRPNMLVWGIWDGINLSGAWTAAGGGYACYCPNTLRKYVAWLRERFTLEALNGRLSRRYRRWEDVEPSRSNHNVVEMLMFRQFHYENLAEQLRWMAAETKAIDPNHEVRSHGAWTPRPWDEECAPYADSWGMSMPSSNLLVSDAADKISDRAFSFTWARSVAREGRWWNEEIYAGMSPGGVTWKKQSDPRALTMLLWMTLADGAAGSMFWQYRPEYMSFESPGYNLVALDGEPTARFEAVANAIRQIEGLSEHLPLSCPRAEVAVVYHPKSQEIFGFNGENDRYLADLRGVYRTLWTNGIPVDVVTPRMDWSGYRLVFLPNVALIDEEVKSRIEDTLGGGTGTRLVAEGSFGLYSADGQSSYRPPEGLAGRLGIRVADVSAVTAQDIAEGHGVVETPYGPVSLTSPCGYAVLEPMDGARPIASLDGQTVGVMTGDGALTWLGFTLSAGFGDVGNPAMVLSLAGEAGVRAPVEVIGNKVVPVVRGSRRGGWLIFLINTGQEAVGATLRPSWQVRGATDLLSGAALPIDDGAFRVEVGPWGVGVVHCTEG